MSASLYSQLLYNVTGRSRCLHLCTLRFYRTLRDKTQINQTIPNQGSSQLISTIRSYLSDWTQVSCAICSYFYAITSKHHRYYIFFLSFWPNFLLDKRGPFFVEERRKYCYLNDVVETGSWWAAGCATCWRPSGRPNRTLWSPLQTVD